MVLIVNLKAAVQIMVVKGAAAGNGKWGSILVKSLCARDTVGVWNYDWRSGGLSG